MQRCTVPLYVYPCCDLISQQRVFRAHQANAAGQSWFAKWQPRRNPRLKGGEQAGRQAVDSIMRIFSWLVYTAQFSVCAVMGLGGRGPQFGGPVCGFPAGVDRPQTPHPEQCTAVQRSVRNFWTAWQQLCTRQDEAGRQSSRPVPMSLFRPGATVFGARVPSVAKLRTRTLG